MLSLQNFPTGEDGFFHNPVLLSGAQDAILIDGVFKWSEAQRIVDVLQASGKRLTTIYISCNDPDFYFGLAPVCKAFPDARMIAAPVTADAIRANMDEKLATWRERLAGDGPMRSDQIILPDACTDDSLLLEGQRIAIITHPGLFDRRSFWVESLRAIVGGTMIVSGNHVWMADTPTHAMIQAWIEALDKLLMLDPLIVVPGHYVMGGPIDIDALTYTRDYLIAFEKERARAADSSALTAAMIALYPELPGAMWLELGAKVLMNEMAWGRGA